MYTGERRLLGNLCEDVSAVGSGSGNDSCDDERVLIIQVILAEALCK